jgi:hypothetical protein
VVSPREREREIERFVHGEVGTWVDRFILANGWMDGWMDGWIDEGLEKRKIGK